MCIIFTVYKKQMLAVGGSLQTSPARPGTARLDETWGVAPRAAVRGFVKAPI